MSDFVIVPRSKLVDYIVSVAHGRETNTRIADHREWLALNDLSDLYVLEPRIYEDERGGV